MHRWSTKTWASLYSVPKDRLFLQEYLPRASLSESYMMNALLALAAADVAHSGRSEYVPVAYEYSNQATADYQVALQHITEDNVQRVYAFAMLANIFNFAMPELSPTAFDRVSAAIDTVANASDFVATHVNWRPPCSAAVRAGGGALPASAAAIDADTRAALARLVSLSRRVRVPAPPRAVAVPASDVAAYRLTLAHVGNSFAEDARGEVKGYCFTICGAVPAEYMAAVKACEPMALLIFMYYGVVVHRSSKSMMLWWIKSTGMDLVAELSELLEPTSFAQMADVKQAISWARDQVGLSPLATAEVRTLHGWEAGERVGRA